MKFKRNSKGGKTGGSRDLKKDAKEKAHYKAFGDAHPVNDTDSKLKVQIVKEDDADESPSVYQRKNFHRYKAETELDEKIEQVEEFVSPFQTLLTDLNKDASLKKSINSLKRKIEALKSQNEKSKKEKKTSKAGEVDNKEITDEENEGSDSQTDSEIEIDESGINTYAQEVLCKDNTESDEKIALDQFTIHFEKNLEEKLITKLKNNSTDRACLNLMEKNFQLPALGYLKYLPLLEETKVSVAQVKGLEKLNIKQRMLDRMNESIKTILSKNESPTTEENRLEEQSAFNLDQAQLETLNIISSYSDLYISNVDVKKDSELKFTYAIHVMNHVLKTRSRVIAHNDKIKQSKSNSSEVEHRDQGLTRPKVLIIVPFRKCALKLVKIFISLIMRKSEEFVSNKKRFFDSFGPEGVENGEVVLNDEVNEIKKERPEDHGFLFSGNVEDHFKIGLSISKKSLKLYTEFYSSDIIIASPLGLKTVIGGIDGEGKMDYDFLSSIEMLIVDNADILMMQNWEHIITVFDHLHLQPKKSHDTDFSRVRNWLLEGHASLYRQTLIFSRIPAPPINNLFNKYCKNYAGKVQTDLMKTDKYQTGSICQIGSQLTQMLFHKVDCDEPLGLPDARFSFFINKILPQFRDEQMAHTLIFIPSYFDFVKIRNYFKKNEISSMHCSEYIDKKSVDRARYLFYHGRVHFMLLTERFHFYNRYRIRGITNLIFYELPHYPEYFSNFCNYLPDPKRTNSASSNIVNFTVTALYSNYDAQKLCAVVGKERATHMINSTKSVHMFMIEEN